MTARLIIKSHHPRRQQLKLALLVLAVLLSVLAVFEYGFSRAGYDNNSLSVERLQLREQLAQEQHNTQTLRARVAVLERAAQVDKQAYAVVEDVQKQSQDEMLELKEEVAFYRGIVAPSEAAGGLNIPRFSVSGIGQAGVYRFKLVFTQLKTNQRLVKGYAHVVFEGVQNGAQTQLSLKQVSGGRLDKLKLRFKYFQNNEGEIVLPDGFLPSRVRVELVPTGKGATRLQKTFDWSDIVSD
jgi:Family of unknown function (DUF6776)